MNLPEVSKILIESEDLGPALRGLYEHHKALNKKFSLQYICNQTQIPSKGHLADVMALRRNLKSEYVRPLCKTFGLNSRQAKIFSVLSKLQKSRGELEKTRLKEQLASAKKLLKSVETDFKSIHGNPVDFARVFCSIGLLPEKADLKSIAQVLSLNQNDVQSLLNQLVERGFLVEQNGLYKLSELEVHFSRGEYAKMVKAYLQRTLQQMDKKINSEDSFFESSTVSVSMKSYRQMLPKLKEIIFESMSEVESESADALIHFNIQIYPD